MTPKLTIELTVPQAHTLMQALELYSRIKMGQLDQIEYVLFLDTFNKELQRPKFDQEIARAYLDQAKKVIFSDIGSGSYIGIHHTSEDAKISWDIYKQLQHDLTVYTYPNPEPEARGNAYDRVCALSKQPLPKITINGE